MYTYMCACLCMLKSNLFLTKPRFPKTTSPSCDVTPMLIYANIQLHCYQSLLQVICTVKFYLVNVIWNISSGEGTSVRSCCLEPHNCDTRIANELRTFNTNHAFATQSAINTNYPNNCKSTKQGWAVNGPMWSRWAKSLFTVNQ